MARMIPATIHSAVRSGAERRMFNTISGAARTENWICLHSLGLARHHSKRLGEIDFVLVTTHGIFVLEVKGGRIRREGGVWIFTDRYDQEHRKTEGPFEQAATAMFTLERELRREFKDTRLAQALIGFGVITPDVRFSVLGPDIERNQIYDATDRSAPFRAYADRLASFWRKQDPRRRRGLNDSDIRRVADFLRGDFDLIPQMGTVLDDANDQLLSLTEEQFVVLDILGGNDRVLIEGPAGSGKTVLAAEAVRRAGRSGRRVLLTCYNKLLAEQLKQSLGDEFDANSVEVCTLHGLFTKMIGRSSIVDEFNERKQETGHQELFDQLMPEYALFAAMEEVIPRFDLLVVDEAQDVLTSSTVEVLSEIVDGGIEGGRWLMFLDSNNQATIYNRFDSVLFERLRTLARSQFLTVNCRNTREVAHHTNLMAQPSVAGQGRVDGPPVEFVSFASGKDPLGKLNEVLAQLKKAGIPGGRITVLLARAPEQRDHSRLSSLGLEPLRQDNIRNFGTGSVTMWAVVSGFKGLENDVIVLVGIEDVDSEWWKAVCYVGMSRARTRLYVLLTKECEQIRKQRWEAHLESVIERDRTT